MNNNESQLERLFNSAAQVPYMETEMPFGFETRVMAGLREYQPAARANESYLFIKWALGGSCALMLLTAFFTYSTDPMLVNVEESIEISTADSAIELAMLP